LKTKGLLCTTQYSSLKQLHSTLSKTNDKET